MRGDAYEYPTTAICLRSCQRCSYAEAARKLIVSPQTVSKAAASMEKRYGIQLFESDGRGVKPTLLGRKFAEDAKLVVRAYDELNNKYGNSTTFEKSPLPSPSQ